MPRRSAATMTRRVLRQLATLPLAMPPPLNVLLGPLTAIGTSEYDTMELAQAAVWENWTLSDTNVHFYDGALNYYLLYYRTGDTRWSTRADFLAKDISDFQMSTGAYTGFPSQLDGSGRSTFTGKDYTTLGMAIYYLRTGYGPALSSVRAQASGGNWYRSPWSASNPNANTRDAAYGLMAMLTSTLLGGDTDWTTSMATAVNAFMTGQGTDLTSGGLQPNDGWVTADDGTQVPALQTLECFMNGLVMEALIMYDRVIGDSRIVPSIKRAVDWMWSTQWVPTGGGTEADRITNTNTNATSTSSVTIGTGTKVFTVQSGLTCFPTGNVVQAYYYPGGSPDVTHSMVGTVTSYSGTTLTLSIAAIGGTGTLAEWAIDVDEFPGDQKTTGTGTMKYANVVSGTVSRKSNQDYSNLMGLEVPAWGYLYFKGQGSSYKTNGDTMLHGCQQSIFFGNPKAYNQMFRSSARYVGWTA